MPAGWPGIINHSKPFSKDYQPENSGRRKNLLREFIHESQLSKQDVKKIAQFVIDQNLKELEAFIKNPDSPILIVAFCAALLKDLKAGRTDAIDRLLVWAFGAPDQKVITESTVKQEVIKLSPVERQKLKDELLAKQGYIKADIAQEQMQGLAELTDAIEAKEASNEEDV